MTVQRRSLSCAMKVSSFESFVCFVYSTSILICVFPLPNALSMDTCISCLCFAGNDYILIEKEKDWCHALQYCRQHYTDLVSIRNETQNTEVIKKGKNKSFWIGLLRDNWEWEDKTCSSFRKWYERSHQEDEMCTTKVEYPNNGPIFRFHCTDEASSFCSKG